MSEFNVELRNSINEFIASESSAINKAELMEVIKDVFSKHKKSSKSNANAAEKVKRKPSAYNIFLKKIMEELKDNGMTAKEKMKTAALRWGEFKKAGHTRDVDNDETTDEGEKSDDVVENKSEPVVDKKDEKEKKETGSTKVRGCMFMKNNGKDKKENP